MTEGGCWLSDDGQGGLCGHGAQLGPGSEAGPGACWGELGWSSELLGRGERGPGHPRAQRSGPVEFGSIFADSQFENRRVPVPLNSLGLTQGLANNSCSLSVY